MEFHCNGFAERAGIEPATAGFIRLLPVLKTGWNTSSVLSIFIDERAFKSSKKIRTIIQN
jgi:hypothetical protein